MHAVRLLPPLLYGAAVFFLFANFGRPAPELKIFFNSSSPVTHYDPAQANINQHYVFLENTYSTLLEYSAAGALTSGLAAAYRWHGPEARFTMRSGAVTVDGWPLDAYDAEFSLKRIFILGKPYEPLRDLLCGPEPLKSQADPCPGLQVLDGGRTLAMRFNEKKDFLFHALTDISYAVIPRRSVSTATLTITDYRNTSGPYYVSADPGGGSWHLAANPRHYRHSARMPQAVRAIPLKGLINNDQALARLDTREFDYLPINSLSPNLTAAIMSM